MSFVLDRSVRAAPPHQCFFFVCFFLFCFLFLWSEILAYFNMKCIVRYSKLFILCAYPCIISEFVDTLQNLKQISLWIRSIYIFESFMHSIHSRLVTKPGKLCQPGQWMCLVGSLPRSSCTMYWTHYLTHPTVLIHLCLSVDLINIQYSIYLMLLLLLFFCLFFVTSISGS